MPNGCWNFTGAKQRNGYGQLRVNYKRWFAHRLSWTVHHGEIPKDNSYFKTMHVLHTCDNPACINPDHLYLGTHSDNMKDRNNRGRTHGRYTNTEKEMRNMNIVEKAIQKVGSQEELARKLTELSGHSYKQGHVAYWKKIAQFPADLANLVAAEIFMGEITAYEACPSIKRAVQGG